MSGNELQSKNAEGAPAGKSVVIRREDGTVASGTPNPGGVPKWRREFTEAFGKRCAPLAEQILFHTMSGRHANTGEMDDSITLDHKLSAATETLKYVLPKPRQEVEVSGGGASPLALLTPELLVALATGKAPKEEK